MATVPRSIKKVNEEILQTELLPQEQPRKNELAKRLEPAITPLSLIQIAVTQGADIDKLSKLLDLQERWERNEARKAYVSAMNAFKAELPEVTKNRHVTFGNTQYDHATLDEACDKIAPALSRHGISHRWKVEQITGGAIRVTCVLTHELGHAEETSLEGLPDTSGSKNSIQAIGSAVTYLERYTLLAATGIAAKGTDTDGTDGAPMEGLQQAIDAIMQAPDLSGLERVFKQAYKDAVAQKNHKAMLAMIAAKDSRKKKLMEEEAQ